jgi:hypothetical protein
MTALVKSEVVEEPAKFSVKNSQGSMEENLPPMSAVRTLPSLMTSRVAAAMGSAKWSSLHVSRVRTQVQIVYITTDPRCLNIIVALRIIAAGLALLVPMRS